LADITQLNSNLWTGGAIANDADVAQIVRLGITADIDCRLEFDDEPLLDGREVANAAHLIEAHPQIAYLWNGVADDGQPKPVSWFRRSWEFAYPLLTDGAVLLIHCLAGKNRGPSVSYFMLRAYWDMSSADAYGLITTKRPVVTLAYREDADRAIEEMGL